LETHPCGGKTEWWVERVSGDKVEIIMTQKTADELNKALNDCTEELLEFMDYSTGSTKLCVKDIIMDHFGPIIKRLAKNECE